MLLILLIVVLIIIFGGGLGYGPWPGRYHYWGGGPYLGGVLGIVFLVLLIALLLGHRF